MFDFRLRRKHFCRERLFCRENGSPDYGRCSVFHSIHLEKSWRASIAGFCDCLLVSLFFISLPVFSQRHVSGRLLTYDSAAVQGAFVAIGKSGFSGYLCSTKTDAQGYFWFDFTNAVTDPSGPGEVGLLESFPNPFSNSASITYYLDRKAAYTLRVFTMLGRCVRTLRSGVLAPGRYTDSWDGRDDAGSRLPYGMYMLALSTETGLRTFKLLLKPFTVAGFNESLQQNRAPMRPTAQTSTVRYFLDVIDTTGTLPRICTLRDIRLNADGDTVLSLLAFRRDRWELFRLPGTQVNKLVLHDSLLYACTESHSLLRVHIADSTVLDTLPLPADWGRAYDVMVNDTNPNILLACSYSNSDIKPNTFGSRDGGRTWYRSDSNAADTPGSKWIYKLHRLIKKGDSVLGAGGFVYMSSNFGLSWRRMDTMKGCVNNNIFFLKSHPTNKNIFWAGGTDYNWEDNALYRSLDGGNSWEWIHGFDIWGPMVINDCAFNTNNEKEAYFIDNNGLILATDNLGHSWIWPLRQRSYGFGSYRCMLNLDNYDQLFAFGDFSAGCFSDKKEWYVLTLPFPHCILYVLYYNDILYAATTNGIFRYVIHGK
jgi:hypothetical protein